MKRLGIALAILLAFSFSANAEMGMMGDQKGSMKQQGMMDEGMTPMMKQMMGQGMMMKDMMQMMMDMMKMQKKMMKGMGPAEKKEMMMDLDKMMSQVDTMMSDMRLMMMQKCMDTSGGESKKEEQKKETPGKEPAPEGHQHKR
ncbi:MAG: hypothetical protein ACHQ0Y_04755 [Thermodesulfovibrionales bacterium]